MPDKQTILIVDDDTVNRKILNRLLSPQYTVCEAANGSEAWAILSAQREQISAVLLDIYMPVMDGYALLSKLRAAHMEDLPVIVTTGSGDIEAERKALDAGAWDFVTKPYDAHVLTTRLKNAIDRSEVVAFEKLQYLSEHDELTHLYNRAKTFAESRRLIEQHPQDRFILLRFDLDHFSLYNTSFGEAEGNALLLFLSDCIGEIARRYPLCIYGRMSADIFCACSPYHGDPAPLAACVEEVQRRLFLYRQDYRLSISVGAVEISDRSLDLDIEDYFVRASIASQNCKGRFDRHLAFYDEEAGHRVARELAIANEMQTALDSDQFVLYLQPKFNLASETVCGAELLVRWQHPTRGLIQPGEFIPVFEQNGFIAKLDYYIWEHTCQLLHSWLQQGKKPYPVSVNISRVSLYNPQLAAHMHALVQQYDLPPALLQLEITESAYMSNPELMRDTIASLHDAGFTILLDDFGSAYSSLNTLKCIDVDVLKVDMKFLPLRDETERGEIILSSVIKMANWLGMSVVVEGVETRRQRDFLEGAGCDCVQGFYYAHPMPQAEYEEKYLTEAATTPAVTAHTPNHNITILVIDDSDTDRAILQEMFHAQYHIALCSNAEEGLAYLKRNAGKVRLILIDIIMPGMSGLEFLLHCRQDSDLDAIPKIMLTASDSVEDQVSAFRNGAYDYIHKPFVREVVAARVNHIMEISRLSTRFDKENVDRSADIDSHTGLLNKMAFRRDCAHLLSTHPDERHALLIIDVDNFKHINDQYGHLAGDAVLIRLSAALTDAFRTTDIIGRFGGDEFVILMTRLPNAELARRRASELIKGVLRSCTQELHISASLSIGFAFFERKDTFDTLFARADQALYEAKSTGKGKAVLYGEKVPPILDDGKPIVLICGEDPQLYPAIALAYGPMAAFIKITSFTELTQAFAEYGDRIRVICLDIAKQIMQDSQLFYEYILSHGGGTHISLLAACQEGNMNQLRRAVALHISDVLTLPPQMDIIQRRLSQAIMNAEMLSNREEAL